MPRVVSANWFSENVSHLCVISNGRLASLLRLAPPYPTSVQYGLGPYYTSTVYFTGLSLILG